MDEPAVEPEIVDHYEHDIDESQRISAGFGSLELVAHPGDHRASPAAGPAPGARRRRRRPACTRAGSPRPATRSSCVDPMPRHVEAARALAAEGLAITAELGDARALAERRQHVRPRAAPRARSTTSRNAADRLGALREAFRVARAGRSRDRGRDQSIRVALRRLVARHARRRAVPGDRRTRSHQRSASQSRTRPRTGSRPRTSIIPTSWRRRPWKRGARSSSSPASRGSRGGCRNSRHSGATRTCVTSSSMRRGAPSTNRHCAASSAHMVLVARAPA